MFVHKGVNSFEAINKIAKMSEPGYCAKCLKALYQLPVKGHANTFAAVLKLRMLTLCNSKVKK